jgi:hypothetical protein
VNLASGWLRSQKLSSYSSTDESYASEEEQTSIWPENRANEQAKWRQKALEKRTNFGGRNTESSPRLGGPYRSHACGNTDNAGEVAIRSEACSEGRVVTLAATESSASLKTSGMFLRPLVQLKPII